MQTTTVAAVSTPRGKGGVAMLRVSGPDARAVLARVFRPRGDVPLRPRTAVYGSFYDDGGVFDDGIAVFYASPASYTGEDTAELCCHGGLLVTELVYYYIHLSFVLPVAVGVMFTLLHALIQTYVLTMLTALFYGEVSEPHPKKAKKSKSKTKKAAA